MLIDSLYSNFINTGFKTYLYFLNEGKKSGDFSDADEILVAITNTGQIWFRGYVNCKPDAEILYNKYDILKVYLVGTYIPVQFAIALIFQIFNRNKIVSIILISKYAVYALFIHALGLISRWYISGHAPWSDGYESMIYVAWATMAWDLFW